MVLESYNAYFPIECKSCKSRLTMESVLKNTSWENVSKYKKNTYTEDLSQ